MCVGQYAYLRVRVCVATTFYTKVCILSLFVLGVALHIVICQAAYLDGCNHWQTFTKVMFPLTSSSVAALTVFTAVFAYADLMWPLVVNSDLNMMTLSSGLATLRGQFSTNFPVLMAGSLLAMLPMVVLYLIFQRQFIEGVAMTGGK